MASIFTRRLAAARLDAGGLKPIYTCPAEGSVVVRDLVVGNLHTAAQICRIYVTTGSINVELYRAQAQPSLESEHLDLRQALEPGDVVSMQSGSGPMTVTMTGYVFDTG